jgi:hypothetical protein
LHIRPRRGIYHPLNRGRRKVYMSAFTQWNPGKES